MPLAKLTPGGPISVAGDKRGAIGLRSFYGRRIRRLIPASLLVTVVCIASPGVLWVLAYSANWGRANGALSGGPLEHFWSLAVEEQFYVVWPLALIWLLRLRVALPVTVLAIVAVCAYRTSLAYDVDSLRVIVGTDTRVDSLLVGCAGAMALRWFSMFRFWWIAALAVSPMLLQALIGEWPWSMNTVGYTYNAVAWLVVVVAGATTTGPLAWAPLVNVGRLSYSQYLWHYPITWLLREGDLQNSDPLGTAVAIVLSFIAAALSYRYVENRWRHRRPDAQPIPPDGIVDVVGQVGVADGGVPPNGDVAEVQSFVPAPRAAGEVER